jgi:hypothetical protein
MTEADAALLVADDHQSGEAEATTTLHGGGDAVDVDQLLDDIAVGTIGLGSVAVTAITAIAATTATGFTSHLGAP